MADINVYILWWQSNAFWATWEPYVEVSADIPNWKINNSDYTSFVNLSDSTNRGFWSWFSIEMPFADNMNNGGESGYIIKIPHDWQGIAENPTGNDMNFLTWESFESMRTNIQNSITTIQWEWNTPIFKGLFWIHWEADSGSPRRAGLYKKNLEEIIKMVRFETETLNLPVLCLLTSDKCNPEVRNQINVVRAAMNYLWSSDNNFFPIEYRFSQLSDGSHHTKESMIKIWELFSDFYLWEQSTLPTDNVFSKLVAWSTELPFQNWWVNFSTSWQSLEVYKTKEWMVHIIWAVKSWTINQPTITVPIWYRIWWKMRYRCTANTWADAQIEVRDNWEIVIITGNNLLTFIDVYYLAQK